MEHPQRQSGMCGPDRCVHQQDASNDSSNDSTPALTLGAHSSSAKRESRIQSSSFSSIFCRGAWSGAERDCNVLREGTFGGCCDSRLISGDLKRVWMPRLCIALPTSFMVVGVSLEVIFFWRWGRVVEKGKKSFESSVVSLTSRLLGRAGFCSRRRPCGLQVSVHEKRVPTIEVSHAQGSSKGQRSSSNMGPRSGAELGRPRVHCQSKRSLGWSQSI